MTQPESNHAGNGGPTLDDLRESIDAVDRALIELLEKRSNLVDQVRVLKQHEGLPMYAPERERAIFAAARAHAAQAGVSADLVEDIFRAVLAQSHRRMYRRRNEE